MNETVLVKVMQVYITTTECEYYDHNQQVAKGLTGWEEVSLEDLDVLKEWVIVENRKLNRYRVSSVEQYYLVYPPVEEIDIPECVKGILEGHERDKKKQEAEARKRKDTE